MKVSGFLRRLICLLAAALMLAAPAAGEAFDLLDLSELTDAQIVSLLEAVNQALVERGIGKTASLPKGAYIGGRDLPAGRYIYTCRATGDSWGNLTVYTDGGKGKQILWHVVTAPEDGEEPETVFITLNDGDELKSGVPFTLTVMSGAIFK